MTVMYISQGYDRSGALARAISRLHEGSFEYVGDITKAEKFPDCSGIVIVGCPEFIFGPEENYWNFLNEAERENIKVAGISVTKRRACFPNNNQGIGKFIIARRRKVKDLAKELSDFFDEPD